MMLPKRIVDAVFQLILQLPDNLHGLYWTIGELKQYLELGGLDGMTEEIVSESIRGTRHYHEKGLDLDETGKVHYYILGFPKARGLSPDKQDELWKDPMSRKPRMQVNDFTNDFTNDSKFESQVRLMQQYL